MEEKKEKVDRERCRQQSKLCAELAVKKQGKYLSNLIDKSSSKQTSLFKVVSEALDKKSERILPTYLDPKELANKFNQYYIDKIDEIRTGTIDR